MTNREDEILANISPADNNQASGFHCDNATSLTSDSVCKLGDHKLDSIETPNANGIPSNCVNTDSTVETNQNNEQNDGEAGAPLSDLWAENPPSSASSGFSDDDSLAGADGDLKTIEQIVEMVKERGRNGLIKEYAEIRARAPEGTFTNAR